MPENHASPDVDKGTQRRAEAGLFVLTIIWGATFIVTKQILPDVSINLYIFLRFAFATVVGALITPRSLRRIDRRTVLHAGILGGLLYGGFMVQTMGLQYTSVANSGFFTGTSVVFTPLIEVVLLRRWPHWNNLVAIGVVTVGLYLLSAPEIDGINPGDVLTLCCALIFGVYIVLLSRFGSRHDLGALTVLQLAFVALFAAVLLPMTWDKPTVWTPTLLFALLYGALLATLVATYMQTKLQPRTTATKTAIIFTAEPLFAALFGFIIAGETLSTRGMAGAACIVVGVLVSELITVTRQRGADARRGLEEYRRGT